MATMKLSVSRPLRNLSRFPVELTDMILENLNLLQLFKLGISSPELLKLVIAFLRHRQLIGLAGRSKIEKNESSDIFDGLTFDRQSSLPTMVRSLGLFVLKYTSLYEPAKTRARIEGCSLIVQDRFCIQKSVRMCGECGCWVLNPKLPKYTNGLAYLSLELRKFVIQQEVYKNFHRSKMLKMDKHLQNKLVATMREWDEARARLEKNYSGHAHLKCGQGPTDEELFKQEFRCQFI
jgi:hypothetical protein